MTVTHRSARVTRQRGPRPMSWAASRTRAALGALALVAAHSAPLRAEEAPKVTTCRAYGNSREALSKAEKGVERAKGRLEQAEQQLALMRAAQEAAVAELTQQPTSTTAQSAVQERSRAVQVAAADRGDAEKKLDAAKELLLSVENAYLKAQGFDHGVGLGLSTARAADGTKRTGLALRYVHPSATADTFEFSLGVSRLKRHEDAARGDEDNEGAPEDRADGTMLSLMHRWSFGMSRAFLSIGSGVTWSTGGLDDLGKLSRYAVLGEISLAFRANHACSQNCVAPWADLRPFLQPWLPFDGSSVAILFGVELGGGLGFK